MYNCFHFLIFSVRVYDVCILFINIIFIGFLLLQVVPTVKKLHFSWPLFRIIYCLVSVSVHVHIMWLFLLYFNMRMYTVHFVGDKMIMLPYTIASD